MGNAVGLIHLVIASLGHPACPSPTPSSFGTSCFHPAAFLSHIIHLGNFLLLNWPQSSLIPASIAGLPNITIQSSLDGLLHFLFHEHLLYCYFDRLVNQSMHFPSFTAPYKLFLLLAARKKCLNCPIIRVAILSLAYLPT